MMRWDFAPMEGTTDALYRRTHHRIFGGADRYWMPFWSPTQDHTVTTRVRRDLEPSANAGIPVVPQILTKSPEDFLWAAGVLADWGYGEVNLNLGCPSGTVTAKGKGAGALGDLKHLAAFLDEIFARSPLPISIKTRLGVEEPEEFPPLLDLYNRYPVRELVVHARVLKDLYRKPAQWEWFSTALEGSRCTVICNGDLKTAADCEAFRRRFPQAEGAMVGRGLLADPAMLRRVKGGAPVSRAELRDMSESLFDGYTEHFGGPRNAMLRMKAHWCYWIMLFDGSARMAKNLRKTTDPKLYRELTRQVLDTLPLLENPQIDW